MRDEKKTARQKQIAEAAYDVLAEKGYAGASMLSIAKKAKASNETLYRWYGNKQGLFRDLVAQNAELVAEQLEEELAKAEHSLQVLRLLASGCLPCCSVHVLWHSIGRRQQMLKFLVSWGKLWLKRGEIVSFRYWCNFWRS